MLNKFEKMLENCDIYSGYVDTEEMSRYYYTLLKEGEIVAKMTYDIMNSSNGWDWKTEYRLRFLDVDINVSCEGDNEGRLCENEELYKICKKAEKIIQDKLEERDREWKKSPPLGHIISNYSFEITDKRFIKTFFKVQRYILRHKRVGKGFNFVFPYTIGKKDKIIMFEAREVWKTDKRFGYQSIYTNPTITVYYSFSERKYTYEISTLPYDPEEEDYKEERVKSKKRWNKIIETLNVKFLLN